MKHLFLLLLVILVTACSNDDDPITNNSLSNDPKLEYELDTLKFTYKNKLYSSPFYWNNDSIVIVDKNIQYIHNELKQNQNLFTFIDSDNVVTYFDSESEYQENEKTRILLRSNGTTLPYFRIVARLYRHYHNLVNDPPTTSLLIQRKFIIPNSRYPKEWKSSTIIEVPNLGVYNLDNKLTLANITMYWGNMTIDNFYAGRAEILMYEGLNYLGEYCSGSADANIDGPNIKKGNIRNMKVGEESQGSKKIPLKSEKKKNGSNFNDIVSSLKIRISYLKISDTSAIEINNRENQSSGEDRTSNEESSRTSSRK